MDLRYLPVQSTDGRLWNTHVSQGLFATLFGPFSKLGGQSPFGKLISSLSLVSSDMRYHRPHAEGHWNDCRRPRKRSDRRACHGKAIHIVPMDVMFLQ